MRYFLFGLTVFVSGCVAPDNIPNTSTGYENTPPELIPCEAVPYEADRASRQVDAARFWGSGLSSALDRKYRLRDRMQSCRI